MEIEFKYRVPPELFYTAAADEALRNAAVITMNARYFDTSDRKLRAASVTLRLRRETPQGKDGATICCVKMPVPGGDGPDAALRRRAEYECEAESVEEALPALIALGLPPDTLRDAMAEGLVVTAQVAYTRMESLIRTDSASYTVCLDRGILGREPFSEIEVEHKSGDFEVTAAAARALAEKYGLAAEPRSKYMRALL